MKWRTHPILAEKFHPDYPDDLQVLVHDGGPRFSPVKPEEVWVTVNGCYDKDVFTGTVLNQPHRLKTVGLGDEIFFIPAKEDGTLLMVSGKYLEERSSWGILPCSGCGLSEVLDAPSDLLRATFKDVPEDISLSTFSTFCPLCDGTLLIKANRLSEIHGKKKFWKFW